jgi:hypothetical protein
MMGTELAYERDTGKGQRCCKTPKDIQIELQNIPVIRYEADVFIRRLNLAKRVDVIFAAVDFKKHRDSVWGVTTLYVDPLTFKMDKNQCARVQLFRHSVSTFLHELAHVMTGFKGSRDGRCLAHHKEFGENLDKLFSLWLKWKEV